MLLIPAMDLRDGRCVRLCQGNFEAETFYPEAPERVLEGFQSLGAPWVHIVDLDGARDGACRNRRVIVRLASTGTIRLQVGGGVRSSETLEDLLDAGIARVVVGSAAVTRPIEVVNWLKRFGAERVCLAFDVRIDESGQPRVRTHGWTQDGGVALWSALSLYGPTHLKHVLCTDIGRDGTLTGPNLALYRAAQKRFPDFVWQASGGVRDATDLAALAQIGVAATVCGKALQEKRITHWELQPFLPDALFPASMSSTARS
jgi:phosphoribosylformimino-5-aminoimidazole carboxamide ribotide isomerase